MGRCNGSTNRASRSTQESSVCWGPAPPLPRLRPQFLEPDLSGERPPTATISLGPPGEGSRLAMIAPSVPLVIIRDTSARSLQCTILSLKKLIRLVCSVSAAEAPLTPLISR